MISQFRLKGGHAAATHAAPKKPAAKPIQQRRSLPAAKVATAKPAPAPAPAQGGGWDAMKKAPPARPSSNEEIISLEDKEFGRY